MLYWLPRIPPSGEAERPSLAAVVDGFRFLKGQAGADRHLRRRHEHDDLRDAEGALPALAEHEFGGGAKTVGYLFAAPYGGALVGSLLSGWTSRTRRRGSRSVWRHLGRRDRRVRARASRSRSRSACSRSPAAPDFFSAVLRTAILMRATPDPHARPVWGSRYTQVAGAPNLGNLEAGVVASLFETPRLCRLGRRSLHHRLASHGARTGGSAATTRGARSPSRV